jgi:triose/dihydroxyacetone kinase / FAD-AMP lyase (cyclizing)
VDASTAKSALDSAVRAVIAAEPDITKYDTVLGDGDCGIGLRRGAEGVLQLLDNISAVKLSDPLALLQDVAGVIEDTMDGTSGALYSIFLNSMLSSIQNISPSSVRAVEPIDWAKALASSLEDLSRYTPARVGDRTILDALIPFVDTLKATKDIEKASKSSWDGMEKTRTMKASLGRAVYIGGSEDHKLPDPGAYGLAVFLKGLIANLSKE